MVIQFFTIVFCMIIIIKLSNIFGVLLCILQRTSKLCVQKSTIEAQVIAYLTTWLCMQNDAYVFSICLQLGRAFQMPSLRTFKLQKTESMFFVNYIHCRIIRFPCPVRNNSVQRTVLRHNLLAIWPNILTWKMKIIKATCMGLFWRLKQI